MPNFIEIIDARGKGHKTGLGAELSPIEAEARAYFEELHGLTVPRKRLKFLLDLYIGDHNLVDTIGIDAAGFERVMGYPPADTDTYTAYDREYWAAAKRARSVETVS